MDLKKRLLHFVACLLYPLPDKQMLQLEYPIKMGRTLNMPSRGGQGRIMFGEITFYPGSGFHNFTPDSFDFELGRHWQIE